MPAEVFVIPIEDKFIIYRPILQLAFVGNRAMADLALDLRAAETTSMASTFQATSAMDFLRAIGFLNPNPLAPPTQDTEYHPSTAVLLLTNRCNLRCVYCYASGGEGSAQTMPREFVQAAIDRVHQNAVELGRPSFDLHLHGGGEPVLAWEMLQWAIKYARSKSLRCSTSLVSNGVWSLSQRDWILHNVNSLTISFDGRPETQNRQRPFTSGQGSFSTVTRTIQALDQARFSYGIRMTAKHPWGQQLVEDVRFICENTGCQAIQVEPAFNQERGQFQGPTAEESTAFVQSFMEAFEVAQKAGRHLTYSGARPWILAQTFCTAPFSALVVNPDGNLVACYEITHTNHPLASISIMGHLHDTQIIEDRAARQSLRHYLEEHRALCQQCFCYWHCAGDCFSRRHFAEAGAGDGTNFRCLMNREITARILLWYIMNNHGIWQGQGNSAQVTQTLLTF